MGSGKTSLGKGLAKRLNYTFIDTDKVIEREQGMSIPQIFEEKGQDYFRELEKAYIQQIDPNANQVIAVGGGMPCFFDNMEQLNLKGTTIYLHRPPGELIYRLRQAKNPRPLVMNLTPDELNVFVHQSIEEREPFYKKAHYHVSRRIGTAVKLYDFILEQGILNDQPSAESSEK